MQKKKKKKKKKILRKENETKSTRNQYRLDVA